MVRKTSRIVAVLLVLALVLAVSACTTKKEPAGAPAEPVKLGILLPATGDLAELGGPMINAVKLAVEHVNAAGGVLGQQVQVVERDTQTNEIASRDAMDQLANVDKVGVVVGAAGSGNTIAALSVAVPGQIVMISPSATSPNLTTYEDNGFFFRTPPSDALQGRVMANLAREEGYNTAATLALNNAYGEAFKNVFIEAFEALDGEIVADILYDPAGTTFDSEIDKIVAARPDVVILIGYPDTGAVILRTAFQKGLFDTSAFLLSEGVKSEQLAEDVGKDPSGRYIVAGIKGTSPKSQGPAYEDFVQAFTEKYGKAPTGPFDAHSYDAGVIALLAMEKAGSTSGAAVKDAVADITRPPGTQVSNVKDALDLIRRGEDIDYEGASSNVNMDDVGDVLSDYEVWQISEDGKISTVKDISP